MHKGGGAYSRDSTVLHNRACFISENVGERAGVSVCLLAVARAWHRVFITVNNPTTDVVLKSGCFGCLVSRLNIAAAGGSSRGWCVLPTYMSIAYTETVKSCHHGFHSKLFQISQPHFHFWQFLGPLSILILASIGWVRFRECSVVSTHHRVILSHLSINSQKSLMFNLLRNQNFLDRLKTYLQITLHYCIPTLVNDQVLWLIWTVHFVHTHLPEYEHFVVLLVSRV